MKFPRSISEAIALLVVLAAFPAPATHATPKRDVTIFAAASTSNAITEIAAAWESAGNGHVRAVFASSGVLARQVDNGAPADLFLSANVKWMDWLAGRGLLDGEPIALLGNRLILVQPAGYPMLALDDTLASRLTGQRLAIGDPDHVPAGIYARQALESMGMWGQLDPMAIRMKDARATLLLVQRGEVAAGIVYASDANGDSRLQITASFPDGVHDPILYLAGIVKDGNRKAARRLFEFLRTPESKAIFRRHGFQLE
jgi:molybdate transport system substrate-binding protein